MNHVLVERSKLLIILGITLLFLGLLVGFGIGVTFGFTFDCEHTTYSGQWNISYIRNVTRYCSDGENPLDVK